MFKTKKDVDKHVRVSLSKLRSESEKHLRGFTIAKLYHNINEYETAEQYLINFLSVKGDSAPAYKLLGDCYYSLKKCERALQAYKRSLQIDPKQRDLLKHVCKILLANENLSSNTVKYWCDLAESLKVQDDSVFDLKLKMLSKNNTESQQIEELITKEIVLNPNDTKFRVQLIRYYLDKNKITQAVDYAYEVEMEHHNVVEDSLDWYNSVWLALTEYKNSSNCKKDWKYWLLLITCIERCLFLSLCNEQNDGETKKIAECLNLLFDFGKYLLKASEVVLTLCPIRECATEFLNHFKGQFCLHAATMLFIKEKNEKKNQWRETTNYAVPLLLFAYHCGTPDYTEFWLKRADGHTRQLFQLWNRQGAFRCVQAGRTLLSCVKDARDTSHPAWSSSEELLSHTIKLCASDSWRTDLFHMLFTNLDHINNMKASYLVSCPQLSDPKFEAPVVADIEYYEETAQYLRPQSLQLMVYLCLGSTDYSEIRCKFFDGLQFSSESLLTCGPECLTQLDVDSFLYASALQAKRKMTVAHSYYEDYSSRTGWKPQILPYPNLFSNLCSEEQSNWWLAAYKVYKNLPVENNVELRTTLKFGLEAVRCLDGPKMDLPIVFKLGQIFVNRAQDVSKTSDRLFLEARVERFYKFGIHMLKLHQKNVLEPFRKLFKYPSSLQNAMDTRELNSLAEEAITYLSARYLENGDYEECLEQLTGIQLPSATYFQAEAYVKMDESNKTSKKKKKHYTEKAKDYFNQTLDLLSNSESHHPLNSLVQAQMKRLQQNRLSIDSFTNGYEHDDYTEDTFITKTPSRVRREILTSSPKFSELENLVRQMNLNLKEELTQVIKTEVSNMRRDFLEFKEKLNSIEDNMKKKSEPPSSDEAANVLEDLCRMDDDLQTQTYSAQQPLYLNFNQQQQRIHTPNALPPAAVNAYNSPLYNTNYPINYYSQYMMPVANPAVTLQTAARNSLGINSHVPFVDPNMNFNLQAQAPPQLPTIADTRPNLISVLGQQPAPQPPIEKPSINPQGNSLSTMWNKFYNNQPVEKGPPINVVITSSDPLPSHTSISQQSNLSVTIPIQHIKSSTSGNNIVQPPLVQPPLQNQSGSINNFSVIQHNNSPFSDLNNFPSMKSSVTFEGTVPNAPPNTATIDASKSTSDAGGFFIKTIQDNKKTLDSESEVTSDFKPINATPVSDNKVKPVKEKNEEVVFSSQIKIFKLQKEWKEQGVGFLKILKNKVESAKRRLVLKDNGQKIYADIAITVDLNPTLHGNDEKCYIINIPGTTEAQQESFRIKFKNVEAAKQFYKSFEDSQKEVKSATLGKSTETQKQVAAAPAPAPFSFNFGKTVATPKQDDPTPFGSLFGKKEPTTSSSTSFVPTTTAASSPFSGLFLTKTTTADVNKTPTIFGVPQSEAPKDLSTKTPNLNVSNEQVEEDDYVPTAQFKPVIPLPDLVEVQTGEENEEILFEHRAKLLRFDSGEWKERGVGNIKLLVDRDDVNRVRLIMRREQVLKLCCNQRVTKDLKFNKFPNNNAVLSWAGQDYSENELRTELFSIRFKTAEICKSFHDAVLKAQENMTEGSETVEKDSTPKIDSKEEEPTKGFGDKFKPAPGSWTCSACYLSNKADAQTCAACNQSKNKEEKKDDGSKSDSIKAPPSKPANSSLSTGGFEGFGDKFKMKAGSWTCKACYINNESHVLYCVACESPKDDTIPKKEPKNIFENAPTKSGGFTFGFTTPEGSKPASGGSFAFGKPMGFSFGTTPAVSKPASSSPNLFAATSTTSESTTPAIAEGKTFGFSLSTSSASTTIFSVPKEESTKPSTAATTTTISTPLSKPAFSFTMPETKEKTDAFNLEKQEFSFVLKPKSPGKTKSPMKNTSGVEEESDNENVEEENNTYFTPVIPLPDKIEVKTGEENEEVLYCHRAKLFRFVDGEWKERGLGDVKILRHSETKKMRVVMRREQVLKICLNHVLNEEVEYKNKDDKSWHFIVNDFSEGEIELMQFCLRFKTPEIAQSFLEAVKNAVSGGDESVADVIKDSSRDTESKVAEITDSEKKMADQLKLPYSFYHGTEPRCTGCRGCEPDDFVFPEHSENQNVEDDRPPLPLEMPKLPKTANTSLLKNSTLSFGTITPQNEKANESKSIFGGTNLFGLKSDTPIAPIAPKTDSGGENKFALNLSQKPGTQDQSKPVSGGFIFGNATSFGSADKAKSTFGQGSVFGGFGSSTFGSNSTTQTSIFGGSTQTNLFSTGDEKTTFPFSATSSTENKENLFSSSKPTFSFTTPSVFSNSNESGFGGALNANVPDSAKKEPQNLFANLASSFNAKKEPEQKSEASSSEVLFKNDPGLSFASLAKDAGNTPTFHTTSNTKEFVGLTGDDAFRNFLSPKEDGNSKTDTTGNEATADDSNHDPHYDPIIELPEEIVVSTGEEEEEKLFGERAFLYRYDSVNKEWKERGVGELKLLHHPGQGTYRLVMRREQIHKLVLNHAITDTFHLNQMNNSGKAFCWAAMNYAEDNGQLEKLAARFKNTDIAGKFEGEVNKCVNQLKKRSDLEPEED